MKEVKCQEEKRKVYFQFATCFNSTQSIDTS